MAQERERQAYICNHKNHGDLPIRVFLLPGDKAPPKCPEGHTMKRQANMPYMTGRKRRVAS